MARRRTARQRAASRRNLAIARRKRSRRNKRIAVGVLAVGVSIGTVYAGRKVYKKRNNNVAAQVVSHKPKQAAPNRNPWDIGDDWNRLKPGDVVEMSLPKPKGLGVKGFNRYYGLALGPRRPTRHSTQYKVTVKVPGKNGGYLREFWANESAITGVKVGGAKNFVGNVKSLIDERRRHRY